MEPSPAKRQRIDNENSWERINRATARRKFIWLTEATFLLAFATFLVFAG